VGHLALRHTKAGVTWQTLKRPSWGEGIPVPSEATSAQAKIRTFHARARALHRSTFTRPRFGAAYTKWSCVVIVPLFEQRVVLVLERHDIESSVGGIQFKFEAADRAAVNHAGARAGFEFVVSDGCAARRTLPRHAAAQSTAVPPRLLRVARSPKAPYCQLESL